MKLSSLITTLCLTAAMAGMGQTAIAENRLDSKEPQKSAQALLDRAETKAQNAEYNIYSIAKDIEITLSNIGQDLQLEDREWYIEKFDQ
ncbi:MAG: hypothetical protein AAGJ80_10160 [Cyanobacteria bacterium J06553_1]